jgi:hypothetical protein
MGQRRTRPRLQDSIVPRVTPAIRAARTSSNPCLPISKRSFSNIPPRRNEFTESPSHIGRSGPCGPYSRPPNTHEELASLTWCCVVGQDFGDDGGCGVVAHFDSLLSTIPRSEDCLDQFQVSGEPPAFQDLVRPAGFAHEKVPVYF